MYFVYDIIINKYQFQPVSRFSQWRRVSFNGTASTDLCGQLWPSQCGSIVLFHRFVGNLRVQV